MDIKSASKFIKVDHHEIFETDDGTYKIPVDITVLPGMPPGQFRESVTAYSDNPGHKQSLLRVIGSKLGNVLISPDQIRLFTYDSLVSKNITSQKLTIKNDLPGRTLEIKDIVDENNRLVISVDTLEAGWKFEVIATLKDEYISEKKGNYSGYLIVHTNDPDQAEIKIRYQVIHRK